MASKRSSPTKVIRVPVAKGSELIIDPQKLQLNPEQKTALKALIAKGDFGKIGERDRSAISSIKVSWEMADATICRFDLKCVKINEPAPDQEEIIRNWENVSVGKM